MASERTSEPTNQPTNQITGQLTNSIELSLSPEANSSLDNREIIRTLWEPKNHLHVLK